MIPQTPTEQLKIGTVLAMAKASLDSNMLCQAAIRYTDRGLCIRTRTMLDRAKTQDVTVLLTDLQAAVAVLSALTIAAEVPVVQ